MWRALDVFTKGHRATSADVLKNITNTFISALSKLFKKHVHIHLVIIWKRASTTILFSLGLDVNTPETLHWHALQIAGSQPSVVCLRCLS